VASITKKNNAAGRVDPSAKGAMDVSDQLSKIYSEWLEENVEGKQGVEKFKRSI
jgi:hypothetical protein